MKRFFGFLVLFFSLFLGVSFSLCSLSFGESIPLSENPLNENTTENIQAARLIEKYFINYKSDLEKYRDDYNIKGDNILEKSLEEIGTTIFQLRKIQTNKVEKDIAEGFMNRSLNKIKDFNKTLKPYLKNISEVVQEETRLYQDRISTSLVKIYGKLDLLIETYQQKIGEKKILSRKETELQKHIINLNTESKKLKNFSKFYFKNKKSLLSNLKTTLLKIRSEITSIQSL